MKKTIIIIAAILMAITASGQIKGIDFDNVVEAKNESDADNYPEQWVKIPEFEGMYVFFIENTHAVDYKHLITELDDILKANDLDINKPDVEDDLLPSGVNGLRDYKNLSFYVELGQAEIMRNYFIDDEWLISILCNYQVQALLLSETEEQHNNMGTNAFGKQGMGETEGSEGVTEGDGNQGVTSGSPDADRYDTGGGLGDGPSYGGLGSRKALGSLPLPNMSGCDITQKIEVKVEIQVDQDGKVVSAIVSSATHQENCIWTMVVEAAKQSRFSVDRNANYRQTGWIRYIIVP